MIYSVIQMIKHINLLYDVKKIVIFVNHYYDLLMAENGRVMGIVT